MQNDLIYRLLILLVLVSFVVHRGIQTRRSTPTHERVVRKLKLNVNQIIAGFLSITALVSSLIYVAFPSWINFASLPFPNWLRWIGIAIALSGFGLMEWAQRSLGKNWSDTPVQLKEQSLTKSGPYQWIRHPIYTAFLLVLSSPLFISANWLVGLSWIAMTYLDVNSRIQAEEDMLEKEFGQSFKDYKSRTGRLAPRI